MNRNHNILFGALLLLVSGACLQSCQQDDWEDIRPDDRETLIAEGRYLTARNDDISLVASDTEEPKLFEVDTPYRLLAFTRAYDATDADNATNKLAEYPRFNKVAWEGEATTGGLRFINIDGDPDKWFGFSALDGEDDKGTNHLVSLDFYGFTYGKKVTGDRTNYILVEGWPNDPVGGGTNDPVEGGTDGSTKPEKAKLEELKHTSTVENGELEDLMRGALLNQNIKTAGTSKDKDGNITDNAYAQSVIPFRHCFSKLRFQVSQQGDEELKDAAGNPTPVFKDLYVESIEVTNTYNSGTVYLKDGLVKMNGAPGVRPLTFKSDFTKEVKINNTDAGEMIVFPSDHASLRDMADGYCVGLNIKVKSTVKKDIENMLANTGSANTITTTNADGKTWYSGTIVKNQIIDYYKSNSATTAPLYLKQNAIYMLIITFQKDGVRIVTVIPQVEEWLPGEGTADDPWEDQAMGHPQMFNNIVWSDRNLGAVEDEPVNGYEKVVGYFYQAGRNIPYYPFDPDAKANGTIKEDGTPNFDKMNEQGLANANTDWGSENGSPFYFYPIVDSRILNMQSEGGWIRWGVDENDADAVQPQMKIPEKKPTDPDRYFNFVRSSDQNTNNGLRDGDTQNMHWEKSALNQPATGAWTVPSSADFMSVFPSTPHAGNITMKRGGNNWWPTNWGSGDENDGVRTLTTSETLRVTVPCYTPGMSEPTDKSAKYIEAWNILKNHNDPGTTHWDEYADGKPNVNEPDGDPLDGYASVYVISRAKGHSYSISGFVTNESNFWIKDWGTIYAIKNIYTESAYRMRWRALVARQRKNGLEIKTRNPCIYIEVCRYPCEDDDNLTEENYESYDWEHPVAQIYFPIAGLGDFTGQYINFGTECQYATSDPISGGKTSAVQIKITGNNGANAYIAVVRDVICRNYGMQIRPILSRPSGGGNNQ